MSCLQKPSVSICFTKSPPPRCSPVSAALSWPLPGHPRLSLPSSPARHLLSLDGRDERELWADKLNETLANIRAWDPDAMQPHLDPSA